MPTGRRPIVATDTSVTAVVAAALTGPLHQPVTVTGVPELETLFGYADDTPLGRAVTDLFTNGATTAVVVRAEEVREALAALSTTEQPFQLLVVDPELMRPGDLAEADAVCEELRAFLVVDADAGGVVPAELLAVGARNAAAYGPRIVDTSGRVRSAAAAVAGVFARNDRVRGVWRASAGRTAEVVGAVGVESELSDHDLAAYASRNVNSLRTMPDGTVVLWGDRTVSTDPEWKYLNVRRHLLCVERSIEEGLQWVLSEANGEELWAQLREDVERFLRELWRRGAFPGSKPEEAYFVRCDLTTMTQDDIDAGHLVVLVGVATIRPAEYVTLRVGLRTGRTAAAPAGDPLPR